MVFLLRSITNKRKIRDKRTPIGESHSYLFNYDNSSYYFQHILKYKQLVSLSRHWQLPLLLLQVFLPPRYIEFVIINATNVESYLIASKVYWLGLDKNANFHFLILKQNVTHVLTGNQKTLWWLDYPQIFTNASLDRNKAVVDPRNIGMRHIFANVYGWDLNFCLLRKYPNSQ